MLQREIQPWNKKWPQFLLKMLGFGWESHFWKLGRNFSQGEAGHPSVLKPSLVKLHLEMGKKPPSLLGWWSHWLPAVQGFGCRKDAPTARSSTVSALLGTSTPQGAVRRRWTHCQDAPELFQPITSKHLSSAHTLDQVSTWLGTFYSRDQLVLKAPLELLRSVV